MQLETEPVESAHIEDFLDLCAEFYSHDGTMPFHREQARAATAQPVDDPSFGRAAWLLAGGERVGYIVVCFGFSLEFGGRDAFVDELYVHESFRGQGLGSAALEWAEELCRTESIGALHLEVEFSNQRAQDLYRRRGFQGHNRHLWTKLVPRLKIVGSR